MRYITYIIVFILFFSCESRTKFKKPEGLISKEQMIDLLTDLHIGVGTFNVKNKDSIRDKNYMVLVFEKYKIDSTQFANSNIYYTSNIEEYEDMLEEVENRLKILRDKYQITNDTLEEISRRSKDLKIKSVKIEKGQIVE